VFWSVFPSSSIGARPTAEKGEHQWKRSQRGAFRAYLGRPKPKMNAAVAANANGNSGGLSDSWEQQTTFPGGLPAHQDVAVTCPIYGSNAAFRAPRLAPALSSGTHLSSFYIPPLDSDTILPLTFGLGFRPPPCLCILRPSLPPT
jgi:hypothetical protein